MEFDNEMIADIEKQLNDIEKSNVYNFPIKELDEIRVDVFLRKNEYTHNKTTHIQYYFGVKMEGVYHMGDDDLRGYTLYGSSDLQTLEKALKFADIFLQNFIVDAVHGKFLTTRPVSNTTAKIATMLRKNSRVKVSMEECCVCKDTETDTKTSCGHFVCIRCISKLPMQLDDPDYNCDEDDDGMCEDRKCPMCRTRFCKIE
jgi:hypothetical protein